MKKSNLLNPLTFVAIYQRHLDQFLLKKRFLVFVKP
jgi:hypothetical protein